MSRLRARLLKDDQGFSLVELLIVIILVGILGGVVTTSLIASMRSTRQNQSRNVSSDQLQAALEQMSRDLRTADPMHLASPSDFVLDRYVAGTCQRLEFKVAAGVLQRRMTVYNAPTGHTSDSTNGCFNYSSPPTAVSDTGLRPFISNVGSATPFAFFDSTGAATSTAGNVHSATITLSVNLPENRAPVSLTTAVTLRNQ